MTDNEIITDYREEIEKPRYLTVGIFWNVLDLINRQKAEIERLKIASGLFRYVEKAIHRYRVNGEERLMDYINDEERNKAIDEKLDFLCDIQTAKSEARKEFVERLKAKSKKRVSDIYGERIYFKDIDNLLKEMEKEI